MAPTGSATPPETAGYADVPGGKVWWMRVASGPKTPLLLLHGGPAPARNDLLPLKVLADERPVIFYDQLGCGRSDIPQDPAVYTIGRFVEEIDAQRDLEKAESRFIAGRIEQRMAKTRMTAIGEKLLSETAGWPASWEGVREDAVLGRALVGVFLPFLEDLVASGAAPTTLRRHFGNVWALGGHIVRQVSLEGRSRRTATRNLVLESVDGDGGPLIAEFTTEEEQASFDSTCRKLSRFLRGGP